MRWEHGISWGHISFNARSAKLLLCEKLMLWPFINSRLFWNPLKTLIYDCQSSGHIASWIRRQFLLVYTWILMTLTLQMNVINDALFYNLTDQICRRIALFLFQIFYDTLSKHQLQTAHSVKVLIIFIWGELKNDRRINDWLFFLFIASLYYLFSDRLLEWLSRSKEFPENFHIRA